MFGKFEAVQSGEGSGVGAGVGSGVGAGVGAGAVSYTHLRAHET